MRQFLLCGSVFSLFLAAPALAQEQPERQVVVLSPAPGSIVADPVTVTYGIQPEGAAGPGGSWNGSGRAWAPNAFLVVDAPAPAAGAPVQADSHHIPFPAGQTQLSVTLPPGPHQLEVVVVTRTYHVSKHVFGGAPTAIMVQP